MINKNLISIIMSLALLGVQASDLSPLSAEYAGPTKLAGICRHDPSSPLESENSENPFLKLLATIPAMEGILNKYIGCSVEEVLKSYIEDCVQNHEDLYLFEEVSPVSGMVYWTEKMSHIVFKRQSKKELDYKTLLELELKFMGRNNEYIKNALQILENSDGGNFKEHINNCGELRILGRNGKVVWVENGGRISNISPNHDFPMERWGLESYRWPHVHVPLYRSITFWNWYNYIVVSYLSLRGDFSTDNILSASEVQHLSKCFKEVFEAQEIYSTSNPESASSSTDSPNR